jgi:hypothetical protein
VPYVAWHHKNMMNRKLLLFLSLVLFLMIPTIAHAQLWSGLLNPTSGPGACNQANISSGPQRCAVDWTTAGVVGGIPSGSWTQSGSTIAAASGDQTATIQAALNGCGTNHYVLLGPGTFSYTHLTIPSNCVLRGSGTLSTILNMTGSGGVSIYIGNNNGPNYSSPATATVTSGTTAGSTSIVVSSASGISAGTMLAVSELNDPVYVSINTENQVCSFCDGTGDGGARVRGQMVQVTNVSGTTLTITPALFTNYGTAPGTSPVNAYYFQPSQFAGLELVQLYANGTGYGESWGMSGCTNCWVKGVFDNYADGNHAVVYWGLHDEIRDSYFSNAYLHGPGTYDSDVDIGFKTTLSLVENNIFERLHTSSFLRWGAAGNVYGYNYAIGSFDVSATQVQLSMFDDHGAHPQFNLYEGNIGNEFSRDSVWGSSSHITLFRNNFYGTDLLASPETTGRNVVNWNSTTPATQQMEAMQIAFPHTNINSIGNVLGSTNVKTATSNNLYNSGSGPFTSTVTPPANRNYSGQFYAVSIGYGTGSDTNGSGVPSNWVGKASGTIFQHGNFDIASNSTIWNGSVTQTLPASFYKSAKPSWFGSVPWPPIGPDVTGGNADSVTLVGHVNAIPAEVCYNNTSRDGVGIKRFDPTACYGGSNSSSQNAPAPPTGLSVIVH